MIGRNDLCWCNSGKKWKKCHFPAFGPTNSQTETAKVYLKKYRILLKTDSQIAGIKEACTLTANILDALCTAAVEGVTTNELNRLAEKLHADAGAIAAPLKYGHPPFPKSICTSLNDMICHGIPNDTPLKAGDILNIDVSCLYKGYYGDCSRMVMIGQVDLEKKKVVDTAYQCLMDAIGICKPNAPIRAIGDIIEKRADENGCSVVYQFVGHGIGVQFHEPPQIPHCKNSIDIPMAPGMTFTIEPMINAGVAEGKIDPKNKWEARTVDGKPSAQWEHTLLITDSGAEILTLLTR